MKNGRVEFICKINTCKNQKPSPRKKQREKKYTSPTWGRDSLGSSGRLPGGQNRVFPRPPSPTFADSNPASPPLRVQNLHTSSPLSPSLPSSSSPPNPSLSTYTNAPRICGRLGAGGTVYAGAGGTFFGNGARGHCSCGLVYCLYVLVLFTWPAWPVLFM